MSCSCSPARALLALSAQGAGAVLAGEDVDADLRRAGARRLAGGRLAAATVLAYIAEGAVGLPVFVGGSGLGYLAGPDGRLSGGLRGRGVRDRHARRTRGWMRTWPAALGAFILGDAIMFACGVAWLSTLIGVDARAMRGFLMFLPAEALEDRARHRADAAAARTIRCSGVLYCVLFFLWFFFFLFFGSPRWIFVRFAGLISKYGDVELGWICCYT